VRLAPTLAAVAREHELQAAPLPNVLVTAAQHRRDRIVRQPLEYWEETSQGVNHVSPRRARPVDENLVLNLPPEIHHILSLMKRSPWGRRWR